MFGVPNIHRAGQIPKNNARSPAGNVIRHGHPRRPGRQLNGNRENAAENQPQLLRGNGDPGQAAITTSSAFLGLIHQLGRQPQAVHPVAIQIANQMNRPDLDGNQLRRTVPIRRTELKLRIVAHFQLKMMRRPDWNRAGREGFKWSNKRRDFLRV